MSSTTIRAPETSDSRAIRRLFRQLDQTEHRLMPGRFRSRPRGRQIPQQSPDGGLFLALRNDVLQGTLNYSIREHPQSATRVAAKVLRVHRLVVDAACRKRGIGTALMQHASDLAFAQGAARLELGVTETNEPARRLYESLGYQTIERELMRPAGPLAARPQAEGITIRPAVQKDIPALIGLLRQIGQLHHNLRPDLFCPGAQKYTEEQVKELLAKKDWHIFVAEDAAGKIRGHLFCRECVWRKHSNFRNARFVFIDDLCVDQNCRGSGIGAALLARAVTLAGRGRFLLLHVTQGNEGALRFYERHGFRAVRRVMALAL